jgi:rhodanese-related sulfurtransferase
MEEVTELLQKKFPDVPLIDTESFAELVASGEAFVVIDTRDREEFAISHLPNAQHAETGESALNLIANLPKDTRVVTYCSIGYRSAKVARALLEAGFRKTLNLDGSIFRWANENRPLAGPEKTKGLVHPFDDNWGKLLDLSRRAPLTQSNR